MVVVAIGRCCQLQITFMLIAAIKEVTGIKILELQVPQRVKAGLDIPLSCHFDLEDETLYSLSWWHGKHQFYQYSPSGRPHQIIYETDDIKVNRLESSEKTIVLSNVSTGTSGTFKCEVVADYPSYSRDSKQGSMEVVRVPNKPPKIFIWKYQYEVGDIVEANCSIDHTFPPSTILWYINGKKISKKYTRETNEQTRVYTSKEDSLYIHKLINRLSLATQPKHFIRDGRAVITCVAVIPDVYKSSTEVHITLPGVPPAEPSLRISGASMISVWCMKLSMVSQALIIMILTQIHRNGFSLNLNSLFSINILENYCFLV